MTKVVLPNPGYWTPDRLERLSHLFTVNQDIMPHQLAVAIGCTRQDSEKFLAYLCAQGVGHTMWLVYHISHPDAPIKMIPALPEPDGSDLIPFYCEECDTEITSLDQLTYDTIFFPHSKLEFSLTEF